MLFKSIFDNKFIKNIAWRKKIKNEKKERKKEKKKKEKKQVNFFSNFIELLANRIFGFFF